MLSTKYAVMLLLPLDKTSVETLKSEIERCGIRARFNVGEIYKTVVTTIAPVGGHIFPILQTQTPKRNVSDSNPA